jgi:hypothetical protein
MKVITPVRLKRRRAPDATPAEDNPPIEDGTPAEGQSEAGELPIISPPEPPPRGLICKSAVRKFLKQEVALPIQVREAFFAAMEAKLSEDLRRSVTRAREQKRNTHGL